MPARSTLWLDGEDKVIERARKERSTLLDSDEAMPHDLSPEQVAKLVGQVAAVSRVQRAWLARKQLTTYETMPLYLLVVEAKGQWRESTCVKVAKEIVDQTKFEGETYVLVGNLTPKKLRRKVRDLPGSLIFSRGA